MTDFGLIRHNLFRKTLRTILMLVAIMIAFLVYGLLGSFDKLWNSGEDLAAADRLITVNRINFTVSMPYAYINRVRALEGVKNATWANWFGGYYQEGRNQIQTFAVDPETYLEAYPELLLPDDQRADFLNDRSSIIVGEPIANQFGWELGQTIPLKSNIFSNVDGGDTWQFRIAGIFTGEEAQTQTNYAVFHWENFNESITFGQDLIGWMIINTTSPDVNDQVATSVDEQFANSSAETETSTEAAFSKAFIAQIGNISLMVRSIMAAGFLTILMIVGTTMVMTIRERTKEIAVLKTIGFAPARIFRLVVGETLLLVVIGGVIGLGFSWLFVKGLGASMEAFLPGYVMTWDVALAAVAIMIGLGLVTGFFPAFNAMRTNIAEAMGKE